MKLVARLGAAGAVVVMALTGWTMSDDSSTAVQAQVEELMAKRKSPEQAEAEAMAREFNFSNSTEQFEASLEEDFKAYGLRPIELSELKRPYAYDHVVDSRVTLKPGKSVGNGKIRLKVAIDKITYKQGGARLKAKHVVAKIKNVSDTPLAYYTEVRSAERDCEVRGSRAHNAMALLPGETADLVVCGGEGAVEVRDLRMLEITPLGHMYLSKLPPQAVGLDTRRVQSHVGPRRATRCTNVPSMMLANAIKSGRQSWADIVDFYARHSCERQQVPMDYKRSDEPIAELPVLGKGVGPA